MASKHLASCRPAACVRASSSPVLPCLISRSPACSLSLWATAGRPPPPPYGRCPGHRRALSQVFFGPFTGDEHSQGTPYPFPSPNLGYMYPDLIWSNYKCSVVTSIYFGKNYRCACVHPCSLLCPLLILMLPLALFACCCLLARSPVWVWRRMAPSWRRGPWRLAWVSADSRLRRETHHQACLAFLQCRMLFLICLSDPMVNS